MDDERLIDLHYKLKDAHGVAAEAKDPDAFDAAERAVWHLRREIYETPAAGSAGWAIKAWVKCGVIAPYVLEIGRPPQR